MGSQETDSRGRQFAATNRDLQPRFLFTVDGHQPASVLPLVCDLLADADAELLIGSPVTLPEQTPLTAPGPRHEGERSAARNVMKAKQQCGDGLSINHVVLAGHGRDAIIQNMIDTFDISTLITEDHPRSGIQSLLGFEATDEAAVSESCDTVIVSRIEHLEAIDSILVPVARGPHSGFAIDVGLALARQNEATLELLHVYSDDDNVGLSDGKEVLETASDRLNGYGPVEQTLLEADDIPDTIIDHAQPADITVFGAPRERKLRQFMLGTISEAVSEEAEGTVLIAHKGGTHESWLDRWI